MATTDVTPYITGTSDIHGSLQDFRLFLYSAALEGK
jgi:hypothetical protein